MYFSAGAEGRISYGHLGRTNLYNTKYYKMLPPCRLAVFTHLFSYYTETF